MFTIHIFIEYFTIHNWIPFSLIWWFKYDWIYFSSERILDFIPYSSAFVSRSHDHPSRARILTSAGPPFSNNLLIARPRNSVEKDPAEWTWCGRWHWSDDPNPTGILLSNDTFVFTRCAPKLRADRVNAPV